MDNKEHNNNEAESLFATRRKKQQEEEAEKARLEELQREKQKMEAEIQRLEQLRALQESQAQASSNKGNTKKAMTFAFGGLGILLIVICAARIISAPSANPNNEITTEVTTLISSETTTVSESIDETETVSESEEVTEAETEEEIVQRTTDGYEEETFYDQTDYDNEYTEYDDAADTANDIGYDQGQSEITELLYNTGWITGTDTGTGATFLYPDFMTCDDSEDPPTYTYVNEETLSMILMSVQSETGLSGSEMDPGTISAQLFEGMGELELGDPAMSEPIWYTDQICYNYCYEPEYGFILIFFAGVKGDTMIMTAVTIFGEGEEEEQSISNAIYLYNQIYDSYAFG